MKFTSRAVLISLSLLMAACAGPAAPPTATVAPTSMPATPTTEPTVVVAIATAPLPTAEPVATATEAPPADYCLDCHTDKERLMVLAKPEETSESESSGVG